MALKLSDKWCWDFWLTQDSGQYHIFYLQAPKIDLGAGRRPWATGIGHACSTDLRHWRVLPDALHISNGTSWDDYALGAGSIVYYNGFWHLFYTGYCRAEGGRIERIGVAVSSDLQNWHKHHVNPVIKHNPTIYEALDRNFWPQQIWRNPYVQRDPINGGFYALISARSNRGPTNQRGVVALARSTNLLDWQVLPPLYQPSSFIYIDSPQSVALGDSCRLLYSVSADAHAVQDRETALGGTYCLTGNSLTGPFIGSPRLLQADTKGSHLGGSLVQDVNGAWLLLTWCNDGQNGNFDAYIADPILIGNAF
jgi:beta-fructofuranosidase